MGIYVFRVKTDLENDLVKVGHTNNSRSRMSHIRSALKNYPWYQDLIIIGSKPGATLEEERALHRSRIANENRAPKIIFQGQDLTPDLTEYYWYNDAINEWLLTFMTDETHFNDNSDEFANLIKQIQKLWGVGLHDIAKEVDSTLTNVKRWASKTTLPRARESEILYRLKREGLPKIKNGNNSDSEGHRIWMSDKLLLNIQTPEAAAAVAEVLEMINAQFHMQIKLASEFKLYVPKRPWEKHSFSESPKVQKAV